jgi:hypothetical protein
MAVAAADAPRAAADLLRTRALLREAGLTKVPWRYGRLPKGEGARTTWTGEIIVRPGTTGAELVKYLRHEARHRLLSPTSRLFQAQRARWKEWGATDLQFPKYVEEAFAEGSLAYPFQHPELYHLNPWRVAREGVVYAGVVAGSAYGGVELGESEVGDAAAEKLAEWLRDE